MAAIIRRTAISTACRCDQRRRRTILVVLGGRSREEKIEMNGFFLQLGLVALGGLLVFLFSLYSIHREKKRS